MAMQPYPARSNGFRLSRWWMWTLLLLGLAAGVASWFLHQNQEKTARNKRTTAPIVLGSVTRKDVPIFLSGLGTVQAYNSVTVRSRVDGQLMALHFTEGENVRQGDVLAEIDDRTLKAQLDQANATKAKDEAQLANAKRDLARYRYLGDSIARQTLESQEAVVKQLEATVAADAAAAENALVQLSYATIESPIHGRTGIRQVDVGNLVHASDTNGIVVVSQIEPISVIFSLPQQHLSAINAQLALGHTLTVDAISSDNGTVIDSGELALVDNQIDQATGTIKLKATFPNHEHALWPGGFTNVRLLLSINSHAKVIPSVAIQRGPKGPFVFTFHADAEKQGSGNVVMTPVTLGIVNGEETEIVGGLSDTDRVVIDGMSRLEDGSTVTLASTKKAASGEGADAAASPAGSQSTAGNEKRRQRSSGD